MEAGLNAPGWDQTIQAVKEVGFPIVAYLLLSGGLGGLIVWAVGYFVKKLDAIVAQITRGQNELNTTLRDTSTELSGSLRELTTASATIAEGMRMTMLFMAHTQTEVKATQDDVRAARAEVQAHREIVEPLKPTETEG